MSCGWQAALEGRPPFQPLSHAGRYLLMDLLHRVRPFVRQHALFRADTRVRRGAVGRIGFGRAGADSCASSTRRARSVWSAPRTSTISFGTSAQRDEEFSASVARSLDVPFTADREDVAARARARAAVD